MIEPGELAAATFSALFLVAVFRVLVPPRSRLAARVRPYTIGSRSMLGVGADLRGANSSGLASVIDVFRPMVQRTARWVGGAIDRMSDESLQLRLRQAGMYLDLDERERLSAYRLAQLRTLVLWTAAAFAGAMGLGFPPARGAVFVGLGAVIGATRQRGRLDRAIESRREMMRIEIYTINQLLAMRVRAGGGVVSAVSGLVRRGSGAVVSELAEALRMHRAGTRATDAFAAMAGLTPEPFCARTYSLLAVAEDRGVDLANGLLALAEDVREARREAIRRSATKRRAAMLIPTIVILAPVMLLFVGAPLPSLLLGFR